MKRIILTLILCTALLLSSCSFLPSKKTEAPDKTMEVITLPPETAPEPTTEATLPPTEAPTTTESPTTTTEAPTTTEATTEAPTEPSVEDFFEGVWQGSDANVTTIEIHSDHTLYYRELNNKKYTTVEGTRGTWTAEDNECIMISLPYLGNGYELKGVAIEDGNFLLQCLNGQPWGDEIIHRSDISLQEIETIVKNRLAQMLKDSTYEIYDLGEVFISWEGEVFVIKRPDGTSFCIYPDRIESTFIFVDYSSRELYSGKKILPIAADCWQNSDYGLYTREGFLNRTKSFYDQWGTYMLYFTVKDGEIVRFYPSL